MKETVRGFQEWQPAFGTIPYPYSNQSRRHKHSETYQESVHNNEGYIFMEDGTRIGPSLW